MNAYPDAEGGMTVGELAQMIGFRVLKTAPIAEMLGRDTVGGMRPYLHGAGLDAQVFIDFVDWATRGDKAARARLLEFAGEVHLDMASLSTAAFAPLFSAPTESESSQ